jgi:phospholipase C
MRLGKLTAVLATSLLGLAAVVVTQRAIAATAPRPLAVPRPDHVVIVVEENHAASQILGKAPYITSLAASGANFTQSFAITHPSQPNYLALFSGATQGITNDSCPHTFGGGNLGSQLRTAGNSFVGYSESLPADGFTGCTSGPYARKHSPWVNFSNLPASTNLRLTRFPTDFSTLPTVSFVIPNLVNDMHDGSVATGDAWLKSHLDPYVQWAKTHNSLLIVTFDEDDTRSGNRVTTFFVGPMVKPGSYPERITHHSVLRTIESLYGLPCLGNACSATPISDTWR